ncbi:MAG: PLP-dependent aminotransferase family protein [Neisseriaceae bacterium]|nr:PLP-dependent aminotransferase family protein [Neisseriaceae bacterium]
MQWKFSARAHAFQSTAIQEVLKVTEQPDIISFAGGLPSADAFPVPEIQAAVAKVMNGADVFGALQYGPTEGYGPLREWVAAHVARSGVAVQPSQVLIVTGSQQALDLIGKALIDDGSTVLVETPTYLGALQSFNQYAPHYVSVASDEVGLDPEALTPELMDEARFLYTIPNFQNPTGRRMPLARRQALAANAKARGMIVVEDDPYGELDYEGKSLPSLYSLSPDNTVYLGSFSKVLAPGFRLGYIVASETFINKLIQLKQATDLNTPSLTQRVAYEVVKDGFLAQHIPAIRTLYAARCRSMLAALAQYMPETVRFNQPEGGMFIWLTLPEHVNTTALLAKAIERKVAFVPGEPFFATDIQHNCLRLAFVTVTEAQIDAGVRILAELIKEQAH